MTPIANSELILNERGAIYHLDLLPTELASTVILVGDPARVSQISKHLNHIEIQRSHREFSTHTGTLGNKRISIVSTGIGPDNIDIVLQELDALVNIDFTTRLLKESLQKLQIIRIGTSGSLQPDLEVDQVVVSRFGLGLDNLLHFYHVQHTQAESQLLEAFRGQVTLHASTGTPYIYSCDEGLWNLFSDWPYGITVTCPGFYGPQGRQLRLAPSHPQLLDQLQAFRFERIQVTNFEMETSAIYGLGHLLGHSCLSINLIIANRHHQTFSSSIPESMDRCIQAVLERIHT
jgi:uridine phosphorylase